MMKIIAEDLRLHNLRVDDVISYLQETGWHRVKHPNDRLILFEGPKDDDGKPIILILPAHNWFSDSDEGIANAINLLSAVEQTSPYNIIQKIQSLDRDTVKIRMVLPPNSAPSLEVASQVVQGLRDLIAFSACMEKEQKRYFERTLSIGKEQIQHFRFGHTFPGSFGFTIESPISKPPQIFQPALVGSEESHPPIPVERRVVERITRGLLTVQEAERKQNSEEISQRFEIGLNANMCGALLNMARGTPDIEFEYTVIWSPRWKPSQDVIEPGPIRLQGNAYRYLDEAARLLHPALEIAHEPEEIDHIQEITIQGKIVALNSARPDDRTVTVLWKGQGRIRISLALEDYQTACNAHRDGYKISITGTLIRKNRGTWTLTNPHDLNVL